MTTTSIVLAAAVQPLFAESVNPWKIVIALVLLGAAIAAALLLRRSNNKGLTVTAHGGSIVGGRDNNEDAYLVKSPLFLIADGMGGQAGGEVASSEVASAFGELDPKLSVGWFRTAILAGNSRMRSLLRRDRNLKGFGTTAVAARYEETTMSVGSCGDSHFFRLRNGVLERLTEEHSLAVAMWKSGQITEEEARVSRFKNVLYRYVGGTDTDPEFDEISFTMQRGDIYLLCSDGLVDYSDLAKIKQILTGRGSVADKVDALLKMAEADATKDNASAIVIEVR